MKYLILISLFVLSLSIVSFAAQDSLANAGKNTVQKATDIPAKSQVNQSLEEEDLLIDEADEKKTAASRGDTLEKKQITAESRKDSGSAVSQSPGVHADSGKVATPAPGQKSDSSAVPASDQAYAPVVKHLDTLRAPATIESIHSINFAKNLKNYRSPKVAMFLSLLVPGLGQAYVKKYYKTGIFVAIEATAIGFSVAFNKKGKDQETKAKNFANDTNNFDYEKMKTYYDGLMSFLKDPANFATTESNPDSAAKAILNDIFYNDTNLISFAQANKYKSQEFYSTIESNTYVQGWKDCQPSLTQIIGGDSAFFAGDFKYRRSDSLKYKFNRIDTSNGKVDSLIYGYSPNQNTFKDMMSKSNSYYKTAQLILITMIINHVVSAVDALISAKAYNDELINKESVWRHISIEQQTVDAGSRSIPGCALTFHF
jgi:hypothetical protein